MKKLLLYFILFICGILIYYIVNNFEKFDVHMVMRITIPVHASGSLISPAESQRRWRDPTRSRSRFEETGRASASAAAAAAAAAESEGWRQRGGMRRAGTTLLSPSHPGRPRNRKVSFGARTRVARALNPEEVSIRDTQRITINVNDRIYHQLRLLGLDNNFIKNLVSLLVSGIGTFLSTAPPDWDELSADGEPVTNPIEAAINVRQAMTEGNVTQYINIVLRLLLPYMQNGGRKFGIEWAVALDKLIEQLMSYGIDRQTATSICRQIFERKRRYEARGCMATVRGGGGGDGGGDGGGGGLTTISEGVPLVTRADAIQFDSWSDYDLHTAIEMLLSQDAAAATDTGGGGGGGGGAAAAATDTGGGGGGGGGAAAAGGGRLGPLPMGQGPLPMGQVPLGGGGGGGAAAGGGVWSLFAQQQAVAASKGLPVDPMFAQQQQATAAAAADTPAAGTGDPNPPAAGTGDPNPPAAADTSGGGGGGGGGEREWWEKILAETDPPVPAAGDPDPPAAGTGGAAADTGGAAAGGRSRRRGRRGIGVGITSLFLQQQAVASAEGYPPIEEVLGGTPEEALIRIRRDGARKQARGPRRR